MENKTLEFFDNSIIRCDEDKGSLTVSFKSGYETKFMIYDSDDNIAIIDIHNNDLRKLGEEIIERLKDTPYKITL